MTRQQRPGRGRARDVYDVAYLAGGRRRVVETAVVALEERGALRAQRSGELTALQRTSVQPAEQAVLSLLGEGRSTLPELRRAAARSAPLGALRSRLVREGLLADGTLARLAERLHPAWALTPAGRQALARAADAAGGTHAARAVALSGPASLADEDLRAALLGTAGRTGDAGSWSWRWSPDGGGWAGCGTGGGSCGAGGGSCGGGGGCGGGGS